MKSRTAKPIPIRRERPVDFLRIPKTNVVDLRPKTPPLLPERQPVLRVRSQRRYFIQFAVIAALLVLPFVAFGIREQMSGVKGKVLGASAESFASLANAKRALETLDVRLAQDEFGKAATSFADARSVVQGFASTFGVLAGVLPQASRAKSGDALLDAGDALSKAASILVGVVAPFLAESESAQQLPDRIKEIPVSLESALPHLRAATKALKDVKPSDVPLEYRESVASLKASIPTLTAQTERLTAALSVFSEILGAKGVLRYLVLFQNNLELRPTGGFIGSLALLDVSDGRVTKLTVPGGGPYDYQSQLSERVIAPEPLHIVNPHWQLQDANWWPDFPTSAQKIMWFYEKSGGPTLDGIIALTPNVLEKLLAVTGPVDFTETYGTVFTSENVIDETLLAVDENEDRPKQVIADLVPEVLERLMELPSQEQLRILAVFDWALREKHLMLYVAERTQQERIVELGWAADIKPADKDYLAVVDTNIGGGKSDGVIDETVVHDATVSEDGSVVVTVTVTRVHRGSSDENDFTGTRNIDFVRFLVPKGSALLSSDGFERIDPKRSQAPEAGYAIDPDIERIEGRPIVDELTQTRISNEFGKTVFANWMGVGPGETAKASITYRLPFRLKTRDTYSVFFQKQPGTTGRFLQSTVTLPVDTKITNEKSSADIVVAGNTISFETELNTDATYGFAVRR